jgi:hypothetical protein
MKYTFNKLHQQQALLRGFLRNKRLPISIWAIMSILILLQSAAASGEGLLSDRTTILRALSEFGVLSQNKWLVHFSHACTLNIRGKRFPVLDVQERLKDAPEGESVNRIIVMDERLRPVNSINYTSERPLYCIGNQLVVFGDLLVDGHGAAGNILTFFDFGRELKVSRLSKTDLPGQAK